MNKLILIFGTLFGLLGIIMPAFSQDGGGETGTSEGPVATVDNPSVRALNGAGGTNAGGQAPQVDEFSGGLTYSFDIPMPPARGSIQPTISLNYNSHRRNPNSWVGYGLGARSWVHHADTTEWTN